MPQLAPLANAASRHGASDYRFQLFVYTVVSLRYALGRDGPPFTLMTTKIAAAR